MTVQCRAVANVNLYVAHKTVEMTGDCEEVKKRLAELMEMESALVGGELKKLHDVASYARGWIFKKFTALQSWLKRMPRWRPRGP